MSALFRRADSDALQDEGQVAALLHPASMLRYPAPRRHQRFQQQYRLRGMPESDDFRGIHGCRI